LGKISIFGFIKNSKPLPMPKTLATLLLSLVLMQISSFADHITVSGDVSGEWNADTVIVTGDLKVPDGHMLSIQPGTIIEFQGSFTFKIEGSVSAIGLENDNIFFQIADTSGFSVDTIPDGGWKGIRFDHNRMTNDASVFINCRFYFGKMVSNDPLTGNGGAINVNNYDKVSISGCTFQDNFATYNGGAIYLDSADISISHSTFAHNRCGPAVAPYGYGGAICSDNSNPDIWWNVFDNNTSTGVGGGLAVRFKDCNLYNNIFTGNTSGLGGGFGFLHIPEIHYRISNNLVAGNFAVYFGGGVANLVASPIYINNTIVYNQAMYGGGFYCKDSISPQFYNTIIWGNMAGVGSQGYLFEVFSQADFFNCDVEGGPALFGGSGGGVAFSGAFEQCLDTIPGFMGSGAYPYALDDNSACIDMGSTDTIGFNLPETDLAGNPRIINNILDMGAYEWYTVDVKDNYRNESPVKVWPNPTKGKFKVQSSKFKVPIQQVELVDIFGKIVLIQKVRDDNEPIEFDISYLSSGIYLVRIFLADEYITKRLLKFSHR
jgi:predicted outer membrane repeat protein